MSEVECDGVSLKISTNVPVWTTTTSSDDASGERVVNDKWS